MNDELKLPEHEKQKKILDKAQIIGEFIDWLRYTNHYFLVRRQTQEEATAFLDDKKYKINRENIAWEIDHNPIIISMNPEPLLAEFFKIDLKKIEEEKRTILDHLDKRNEEDRQRREKTSMLMYGMDYTELPDVHKQKVKERIEWERKREQKIKDCSNDDSTRILIEEKGRF